jgi:hypothetical protein
MSGWRTKRAAEAKKKIEEKNEGELKKAQGPVRKTEEKEKDDAWLIVRSDAKFDEPDEVPNEKL